jgi:hypothetical protein
MQEISAADTGERRTWRGWRAVVPPALIVVALGLGAWNARWRSWNHLDEVPEQWDEAHLVAMSIRINDRMRSDPAAAYDYFVHASPNQAPFTSLLGSFLYFAFPRSVRTALMLNGVCMAVLLISVYLLGARRSVLTGAIAAGTVACMMPVIEYMRLFRTEMPLAAWVSLAILLISLSDRFRRFVPTLLAGVVCGVAMLTNPIALVFLLGPVCYALIRGVLESRLAVTRVINIAVGLIAAFAVASVWYLPNMDAIREFLLGYGFGQYGAAYRGSHPGFTLYPQLIRRDVGAGLIIVAIVAGLFALVLRTRGLPVRNNPPRGKPDLWLVAVWVVVSYLFLNLTRDQQTRFLLPLLPGAAVLLAVLITSIRYKTGRIVVLVLLSASCGFGLYAVFSRPQTHIRNIDITKGRDWRMREITGRIAEDSRSARGHIAVAFLANHALFTAKGFDLAALLDGHDFRVNYVGEIVDERQKLVQVRLRLAESRYAVFKTGRQMEEHARRLDIPLDRAIRMAESMGYGRTASFTLPDGSEALLYRKGSRHYFPEVST